MKLPIKLAEKLLALQNGDKLPYSLLKYSIISEMLDNGILKRDVKGRSKTRISITDKTVLTNYLSNQLGIHNLRDYITAYRKDDLTRTEAIEVSTNSKLKVNRTFTGFLVNSIEAINCRLNEQSITLIPTPGVFTFVYDYSTFIPPPTATIVGVENPTNFRWVEKQHTLFPDIQPLFVSRYPYSKDLIRWLQKIPNPYLHFGDFDFAGLNIYMNEYKKHLQDKSTYFLPNHLDLEKLIASKGNRKLYDNQSIKFDESAAVESTVANMIRLIRKHKKGLEQEVFINMTS